MQKVEEWKKKAIAVTEVSNSTRSDTIKEKWRQVIHPKQFTTK